MAVTQYIGARYVPLFADPIAWDGNREYEPLTIVTHQGNSYTSRQTVPRGIAIDNEDFWALTGDYNAQIEQYRLEVQALHETVNTFEDDITNLQTSETNIKNIIPYDDFSPDNTVKSYIDRMKASFGIDNLIAPVGSLRKIGTLYSETIQTFQGCFFYNNHYYAAHYVGTNGTILTKYDSDFNVVNNYAFGFQFHANSINLNPNKGTILVSGSTSSTTNYIYEFNPETLDLVNTIPFMYVNGFCINSNGLFAAACMTGSDAYMIFALTREYYVSQGITPAFNRSFPGRQQIAAFNTGFCRLESRGTTEDQLTPNIIVVFTATGQHKFNIAFEQIGIEFEGITYIDSDKKFILSTVRGDIYELDVSVPLRYFTQFEESTNNALTPSWAAPSPDENVVKSTLGNYNFMVRAFIPKLFRLTLPSYTTGFIAGPGQGASVSLNTNNTSGTVSGIHNDVNVTTFIKLDYSSLGSQGTMYLSRITIRNIINGYYITKAFEQGTTNEDYITGIDDLITKFRTNNDNYSPFPESQNANGFWAIGVIPNNTSLNTIDNYLNFRTVSNIDGLVEN